MYSAFQSETIMNSITTLIVDDEEDGRSSLRCLLERYCPGVSVVAEAASVSEAIDEIGALRPKLVFLDVNMPFENGFSLFSKIPEPTFKTIFVTAYDSYALQAIKHHALDYLLKPIDIDELVAAVQHAARSLAERTPGGAAPEEPVSRLLQELPRNRGAEKVSLAVADGFLYVLPASIIRCEANGNYTHFYFAGKPPLLVCRALGYYEALLEPFGFIRVHHHHLINPAHVERYQRGRGGMVVMSDGSELGISQRKKDDFLGLMGRWGMQF